MLEHYFLEFYNIEEMKLLSLKTFLHHGSYNLLSIITPLKLCVLAASLFSYIKSNTLKKDFTGQWKRTEIN